MDKKVTDVLAYISILGFLVAYIAGDRENSKFHLNQALVLNIAGLIFSAVARIPLIGYVSRIGGILVFLLCVWGIICAINGEEKELPLVGTIKILN